MLIHKFLSACFIIGCVGSLFVWRKKRFAKLAPLYFGMLGLSLGFYVSLIGLILLAYLFDSYLNGTAFFVLIAGWLLMTFMFLVLGVGLGFFYSSSVSKKATIRNVN